MGKNFCFHTFSMTHCIIKIFSTLPFPYMKNNVSHSSFLFLWIIAFFLHLEDICISFSSVSRVHFSGVFSIFIIDLNSIYLLSISHFLIYTMQLYLVLLCCLPFNFNYGVLNHANSLILCKAVSL